MQCIDSGLPVMGYLRARIDGSRARGTRFKLQKAVAHVSLGKLLLEVVRETQKVIFAQR